MLRLAVSVVHSLGLHVAVDIAARELWAIRTQRALLRSGGWMDEAAADETDISSNNFSISLLLTACHKGSFRLPRMYGKFPSCTWGGEAHCECPLCHVQTGT